MVDEKDEKDEKYKKYKKYEKYEEEDEEDEEDESYNTDGRHPLPLILLVCAVWLAFKMCRVACF